MEKARHAFVFSARFVSNNVCFRTKLVAWRWKPTRHKLFTFILANLYERWPIELLSVVLLGNYNEKNIFSFRQSDTRSQLKWQQQPKCFVMRRYASYKRLENPWKCYNSNASSDGGHDQVVLKRFFCKLWPTLLCQYLLRLQYPKILPKC